VDIKTYVQEQESGKAVRLRNEYHQGVHELIAPDIFPTEMCNVLMILERSGKIKQGDADLFFRQFLSELPPLFAAVPLLPRALEIAKQFRSRRTSRPKSKNHSKRDAKPRILTGTTHRNGVLPAAAPRSIAS
jgi:hypothetical protein